MTADRETGKTVVIVQARMGSTRLPGKVLRDIAGRPMIDRVLDRARRIRGVDEVVVATSDRPREAPLLEHLRERRIPVHRGPESDVLARYVEAARAYGADAVLRITGDCPLLMPEVSSRVVERFWDSNCTYASNTIERTYPRGLDTEVIGLPALEETARSSTDQADREHVTRYVRRHPDRYDLCSVTAEEDRSDLRWTVDEEDDLTLVRRIYRLLDDENASYEEVLQLVDRHEELRRLNDQVRQRQT